MRWVGPLRITLRCSDCGTENLWELPTDQYEMHVHDGEQVIVIPNGLGLTTEKRCRVCRNKNEKSKPKLRVVR